MKESGGMRVVVFGLLSNFAIAAFKYFAAYMSGSSAMLAEGHHSLADTINQVLLLVGLRRSRQASRETHPFGRGKEQYFWSFVVALVLFGGAGGLSIKGGILKILHPEPIESPLWPSLAVVFSLVFDGMALAVSLRELRARMAETGEKSLITAFCDCTDAVVITSIMENLLAVLGLLIVAVSIPLAHWTGRSEVDAWASVLIGVILMVFALLLAVEVQSLLIGESLPPKVIARITEAVESGPRVRKVVHVRTLVLGPEEALVAVKVEFEPTTAVRELEDAIDEIEAGIRKIVPNSRCYIEAGSLKTPPNSMFKTDQRGST